MGQGNRILIAAVISVGCLLTYNLGYSEERYFLNDQRVLLYKLINWWYHAAPAEAHQICGDSLRSEITGGWLRYESESGIKLALAGEYGCGSLISLKTGCGQSPQRSHRVDATWVNTEYFESGQLSFVFEERRETNDCSLVIYNVSEPSLEMLRTAAVGLQLTISGRVNGLGNGKVALLGGGDCYERCSKPSAAGVLHQSVQIDLVNTFSGETLASFKLPHPVAVTPE